MNNLEKLLEANTKALEKNNKLLEQMVKIKKHCPECGVKLVCNACLFKLDK